MKRGLLFACVLLIPTLVKANVWPCFGHDSLRTGVSPYHGPRCCDQICWIAIEWTLASPTIDGSGHMYVQGASGFWDWYLWCVNTSDCSSNWRYRLGAPDGEMMHKDPTSTCAITPDGSVIYLGFKNNLYAITSGGGLSWTYGTGAWVRSSPVIGSDGTIYVGSDDDCLHAVNPGGTGKWTYLTGGDVRSSPALSSDGTVYVGSDDGALHAIDPTGSVKWSYATGSFVRSSPAVGSDGTIYVGSDDTYLYAINPDGSLKWQHKTDGAVFSSPAIDDGRGTVYVGSIDSCLRAINTADGSEKWKTDLDATIEYSSPAVAEPNNMIYTGAGCDFHVIDGSDGLVVCTNSHPYGITSPAIDNPATNGGNWCVWYNIWSAGIVKVCCPPIGVENESSRTELRLELFIHPNLGGSNTSISFGIPAGTHVLLEVYDVTGRLVQELARGTRSAGEHTVEWNTENLADGMYFCRLTTGTGTLTRKVVLVK